MSKKIYPRFIDGKAYCAICDEPHHARGYCKKHYMRLHRWGSPFFLGKTPNGKHKKCKVKGCPFPPRRNGYCEGHAARLKRTGGLVNRYGSLVLGTVECK